MLLSTNKLLTVLINEHTERNSACVESIQEILDIATDKWVEAVLLFVFNHSLGHGGDHIIMSVPHLNEDI